MTKYQLGFLDAKTLDKPLLSHNRDYMNGWNDCKYLIFGINNESATFDYSRI
jgi:hypothetical protein